MPKKKTFDPTKLPSVVYVKWEEDGDDSYLSVYKNIAGASEEDGAIIGSYALVSVGRVNVFRTLEPL